MTTPSTPDCRIRFPAVRIDFENDVGIAGQDHDNYPAPGQQPRFDWMRSVLTGLLSNQSSYQEPTEFRNGTLWFDLNNSVMKVRLNDAWVGVAEAISLELDSDGEPVTLQDVYATIKTILGYKPTASFGGHSSQDAATSIPIPAALRTAGGPGSRPFVWVDGLLVDPRSSEYVGGSTPTSIRLTGGEVINKDQSFNVIMLAVDPALFSSDEVVI